MLQESGHGNSLPEGQVVEDIVDMLRNRHALAPAEGGSILGYTRNNPFFMSGPLPQRGEPCLELLCNKAVHVSCAPGGRRYNVLLKQG